MTRLHRDHFTFGAFDLWAAAMATAAAIYFFSGYFTTVRFESERIVIDVEPTSLRVAGTYYYANRSVLPAVLTLRVPFPTDVDHDTPQLIALHTCADGDRTPRTIAPIGPDHHLAFRLVFRPGEVQCVELHYRQTVRVPNGRYILVTTRAWGRSLERGDYVLRVPRKLALVASSYALASIGTVDGRETYAFSSTDFYPDRDWEFRWAATGGAAPSPPPTL